VRLITSYSKKQKNLEAVKISRDIVNLPRTKTEGEFEEEFHNDTIKFNQMEKKQIQQEAKIWAKMKLNSLTADNFLWLYPICAIYYYANLLDHLFIFSSSISIDD
jgi:hypothetical protein